MSSQPNSTTRRLH